MHHRCCIHTSLDLATTLVDPATLLADPGTTQWIWVGEATTKGAPRPDLHYWRCSSAKAAMEHDGEGVAAAKAAPRQDARRSRCSLARSTTEHRKPCAQ